MTRNTITALSISLFIALLTWGIYTFIIYTGVPAHGLVYLDAEQAQAIAQACGTASTKGTYWCRGWETLPYFLGAFFTTARPFLAYVALSLLAYGAFLVASGYKTGRFSFTFTLRPIHVIGAFAVSVWLIGTLFSIGSLDRDGTNPFRRLYEPKPEVYSQQINPETLAALQENYQGLLDRDCLREIGTAGNGVKVYDMRLRCMQQSLIVRAGLQIILLLILSLNFLVAGSFVLKRTRAQINEPLYSILSFSAGAALWLATLWLLAVLGIFRMAVITPLFFLFPVLTFPLSREWVKRAFARVSAERVTWSHLSVLLAWLLLSYLALNFLNVVRPFPIGWDDLGSYLNRPRLLASYGSFIGSMATTQWEYLSAMAYALFGIDNATGNTFAMQVNWLPGALSVLALFAFGRMFLGARAGLLAAILFYFLPMTGHFSFADMKIDNASFLFSSVSLIAMMVWAFGMPALDVERPKGRNALAHLFLIGIVASLAFAIKPTAILMIFFLLSVLAGSQLGGFGFAAASAASFVILGLFAPFDVAEIAAKIGYSIDLQPGTLKLVVASVFGLLSLALFIHSLRTHLHHLRSFFVSLLVFVAGMALTSSPWMIHNAWSNGGVTNPNAFLGYNDNTKKPHISYLQEEDISASLLEGEADVRYLPPELALDPQHPQCTISARTEELDRYWGFGGGWSHYLTLAWRSVMNSDQVGYYVTLIPALLLVPLVLLLPFFWKKESLWLRFLFAGTMIFFVQWTFIANGIAWYGIGMFFGFAVILEVLALRAPDMLSRVLISILIALSIMIALVNRMWQFDVQKNLFEYPLGKATHETIREVTIPYYDDIRDSVLERHEEMSDRPYTFRMGTFIAFFIPRNIEVLPLADHQLAVFNCINQERDHALTLRRLQALGFNSMIFDTNTATIEKDPNGTLHQKVNALLNFLNDPTLGLDIVINDPSAGIAYVLLP